MHEIFISYRTDDAAYAAAELYRAIGTHFGPDRVFYDCTMPPSTKYPKALKRALERCEVVVAVIGPRWLASDQHGRRAIDQPTDWVRTELTTAIELGRIVLPVLLDDTAVLEADRLPHEIRSLAHLQFLRVRRQILTDDVRRLTAHLEDLLPRSCRRTGTEPTNAPAPPSIAPPAAQAQQSIVFMGNGTIGQAITGDSFGGHFTFGDQRSHRGREHGDRRDDA